MSAPRHPAPTAGTAARSRSAGHVLVVDDEVFIRNAFQLYLETVGFTVESAENGERALEIFDGKGTPLEVVILDLVMPGLQGIDLLKIFKSRDPLLEVIIITGCGSIGTAIEALRHGAFDYIQKPIVNFDEDLLKVVHAAIDTHREKTRLAARPKGHPEGDGGSAQNPFLAQLVEVAAALNRPRGEEPILEELERLLRSHFAVAGGIVLCREPSGDFTPVYSWGFSGPVSGGTRRFPDSGVFAALHEGALSFFPTRAFDGGKLGIAVQDLRSSHEIACLPLRTQGSLWGSLIVFFSEDLPRNLTGAPERSPFQVLSALLGPVLSGTLAHSRPEKAPRSP